jgi:proteasome lid subunit RPN8/RPN11
MQNALQRDTRHVGETEVYGPSLIDADGIAVLNRAREVAASRLGRFGIARISDLDMFHRCVYGSLRHERCGVASFDSDLRFLGFDFVAIGDNAIVYTATQACVAPALARGAKFVVVSHNHPTDNPKPSQDDIETCGYERRLFLSCGVGLVDWIVVTRPAITSLCELKLPPEAWTLRSDAAQRELSRNESVQRAWHAAALTDDEGRAYQAAREVLGLWSTYPLPMRREWMVGAFRKWLQERTDYELALFAVDHENRQIEARALVPRGTAIKNAIADVCASAVLAHARRVAVAIHRDPVDGHPTDHLVAFAMGKALKELQIDLMDVLWGCARGWITSAARQHFDYPPEAQ